MQVYTSSEADKLIRQIRKYDPAFNFAGLFFEALKTKAGLKSSAEEEIQKNLSDAKAKLTLAENEIKYWEERWKEFIIEEELAKIKKSEDLAIQEREKKREEEKKKAFIENFEYLSGRKPTDEEYDKYQTGNYVNIMDLIKEVKGESQDA